MNIATKRNPEDIELERINATEENTTEDYDDGDTGKAREDMADMLKKKDKVVCFHRVRGDSVGYWNMYALYFSFFFCFLENIYAGMMGVYIAESSKKDGGYAVSSNQVNKQMSDIQSIQSLFSLVMTLIFGALFDIIGRRKPAWFFFTMVSLGWAILPLGIGASHHTLWTGYFLATTLNNFSANVNAIPIIPDIIMENSQGLAKSFTMALINIAALCATHIQEYVPQSQFVTVCWSFFGANTFFMFTICPGIKNIVGSKEHVARGVTSQHSTNKSSMLKVAYAQAAKTLFGNPMVLISVMGRMIADAVRLTTANNIVLNFEQNFSASKDRVQQSKVYYDDLQNVTNYSQIVVIIFAGWLINRYNHFNILIITSGVTLAAGIGMTLTVQNTGVTDGYSICYVISENFDYVNNLVGGVMIYSYLELESRGIVLSLAAVFITLMKAILTFMNGQLNSKFYSEQTTYVLSQGKTEKLHNVDYLKGSVLIMSIGYGLMGIYFVIIVIYRYTHWDK